MNSANRVVFNTAISYGALIFKILVSLFSVRFILRALGETNYGLYVAVAGIASMLEMINSGMSNASMRYLAYSLGSNNDVKIKETFDTTLFTHYLAGFVTIFLMEAGGVVILEYVMNIPSELMADARIIYQMIVITAFITVIAIPYDAVMNAHEHIWMLSLFDILSAILTLIMALYLSFSIGNRLLLYGVFLLSINIIIRFLKVYYSKKHFQECRKVNALHYNKQLIKEILSFTGWSLFGNLAAVISTHIRGIIINMFFGVRINASEGISRQVGSYVNMAAVSMTKAVTPQLNKSEGEGNRQKLISLTTLSSKYSSFLFSFVCFPFILETGYILKLWLGVVPEYAVVFCQISLLDIWILKFVGQINNALFAVGDIKQFQILAALTSFVPIFLTFFFFKLGYPPESAFWTSFVCEFLIIGQRYYLGKRIVGLDLWDYTKEAVINILVPCVLAFCIAYFIHYLMLPSFFRVIVTSVIYCFAFSLIFYLIGMKEQEVLFFKELINRTIGIIRNKYK